MLRRAAVVAARQLCAQGLVILAVAVFAACDEPVVGSPPAADPVARSSAALALAPMSDREILIALYESAEDRANVERIRYAQTRHCMLERGEQEPDVPPGAATPSERVGQLCGDSCGSANWRCLAFVQMGLLRPCVPRERPAG